jgi:hypothetical protein
MNRVFFGLSFLVLALGLVIGLPGESRAEEFMTAYLRWQAPATGSPAVRYLVRIRDIDGTLYETTSVDAVPGSEQSYTFNKVEFAHRYQGRVAGIDAQGRQGPWSDWSPVYVRESSVPQP